MADDAPRPAISLLAWQSRDRASWNFTRFGNLASANNKTLALAAMAWFNRGAEEA